MIKVVNPNDTPLNFRVRSIPVWESVIQMPQGFVEAYDAQWLHPEKDIVAVEPNSIAETSFSLDIPDLERVPRAGATSSSWPSRSSSRRSRRGSTIAWRWRPRALKPAAAPKREMNLAVKITPRRTK